MKTNRLVGLIVVVLLALSLGFVTWQAFRNKGAGECRPAPSVDAGSVKINMVRLDHIIENVKDTSQLRSLLDQHPLFFEYFMQRSQLPDDSIIVNDLKRLKTDRYIDTMYADVQRGFGDLKDQKAELEHAFAYLKHYYPQHPVPALYTIVSGFSTDLFASDSIVVWGLESYLGDSGHYQPPMIPRYISYRMRKPYLVPSTMLMVSNRYNQNDMLDNTMLKEMIQWGKAYYFVEQMMPCVPDSIIIGYTAKQADGSRENLRTIWSHFTKNRLFYETNHMNINRYIGERPAVQEIGRDAPGRIGRYLGWQIVRAYAATTGASLPEIMAEKDAKKILNESKFRPE